VCVWVAKISALYTPSKESLTAKFPDAITHGIKLKGKTIHCIHTSTQRIHTHWI